MSVNPADCTFIFPLVFGSFTNKEEGGDEKEEWSRGEDWGEDESR